MQSAVSVNPESLTRSKDDILTIEKLTSIKQTLPRGCVAKNSVVVVPPVMYRLIERYPESMEILPFGTNVLQAVEVPMIKKPRNQGVYRYGVSRKYVLSLKSRRWWDKSRHMGISIVTAYLRDGDFITKINRLDRVLMGDSHEE